MSASANWQKRMINHVFLNFGHRREEERVEKKNVQ